MEEYKEWLKKAEQDFDTAKYNINGGKLEAGLFFLQQTAEKSLKALYIKKFNELLKTHDLFILSKKLNIPQRLQEFCKKLSPAYQYTRYPDVSEKTNLEERAKEFLNYAEEILQWTKKNL